MLKFFPNIDLFCKKNKYYELNEYKKMTPVSLNLPSYEDIKEF